MNDAVSEQKQLWILGFFLISVQAVRPYYGLDLKGDYDETVRYDGEIEQKRNYDPLTFFLARTFWPDHQKRDGYRGDQTISYTV